LILSSTTTSWDGRAGRKSDKGRSEKIVGVASKAQDNQAGETVLAKRIKVE
jgi:hypothetical protein